MNFAGKAAASADKVRGGYYTPAPVARFWPAGFARPPQHRRTLLR